MHSSDIAARKELIRDVHERGQAYNNLVLSVGYAGFFALWVIAKDYSWPRLHAVALLGIAISLLSFIGWEVTQVYFRSVMLKRHLQSTTGLLSPQVHDELIKTVTDRAIALWIYFFIPAVVGAVVGSGLLMWILIASAFAAFQ